MVMMTRSGKWEGGDRHHNFLREIGIFFILFSHFLLSSGGLGVGVLDWIFGIGVFS